MTEHEATRTLVKSPPELWAECSDAGSLSRHLAESFGEIRITTLEPETAVAWEGEHVSGTVRIEPSAWGTRVTLTAVMTEEIAADQGEITEVLVEEPAEIAPEEPVAVEAAVVVEEPAAVEEEEVPGSSTARKRRFMTRVRGLFRSGLPAVPADAPEPTEVETTPEAEPAAAPAPPEVEPVVVELQEESAAAAVAPDPEPEPSDDAAAATEDPAVDPEAALTAALDSLGQAHHRPFSRA
jgi:hypothetical protein